MDRDSIIGYTRAAYIMHSNLEGKVSDERLLNLWETLCEDPRRALVEYVRLSTANHVFGPEVRDAIGPALNMVDSDCTDRLTIEEQGTVILEWYRLESAVDNGVSTAEAAKSLGVTRQRVAALIKAGQLKASKPKGRLVVDKRSLDRLIAERSKS